jgi:hypothetical protein
VAKHLPVTFFSNLADSVWDIVVIFPLFLVLKLNHITEAAVIVDGGAKNVDRALVAA